MIDVIHIDKPFQISELPLKSIYVLDDWLSTELHHHFDNFIRRTGFWSKNNQVDSQSPTGLPHHSFWGMSFFRDNYKLDTKEKEHTYFVKYLDRRLQKEFGFKWVRFQYTGLNSQTVGLQGTTHADCKEHDEWNLSFLYYTNTFWNDEWGGKLRFYDKMQSGLDGREEHIKKHQVAEVDFKPNRLLMFDGRIPHGADAPGPKARYIDRRSLVIRGDEIRLIKNKEEYFYANDRFHIL